MTKKPKHDQIFKKAMENPIVAHEFLRVYLPKDVQDVIDTKTLKLEKDSFLSTELDSSFSDVLFSAKFNGDDGYIFLLLEHQSRPEHLMAFRLFKYMINICEQYLAQHPKAKYLPLIYPCVIYNGTKAYDAPRNIWDLFSNKKLARTIWTDDYQLINVHEIPDTELKKHVWSGILMFFMKHIHERQLLKRWHEIAKLLPIISELTVGTDYIKILLNYTLLSIDKNDKIELENLLISTLNQQTGTEIMGSLAQSWKEKGIQIGIQDGIQIGKAEGIQIGEARGKAEGVQIGKAEGEEQKALAIATAMLRKGRPLDEIIEFTGLSVDKISKLKF